MPMALYSAEGATRDDLREAATTEDLIARDSRGAFRRRAPSTMCARPDEIEDRHGLRGRPPACRP